MSYCLGAACMREMLLFISKASLISWELKYFAKLDSRHAQLLDFLCFKQIRLFHSCNKFNVALITEGLLGCKVLYSDVASCA